MTPREFKIWFDGFMAAADDGGVTSDSLQKLADKVYEMDADPLAGSNLPKWTPPQMNNTMPLNYPYSSSMRATNHDGQIFDPSVVYNNGAIATSSTGKSENV